MLQQSFTVPWATYRTGPIHRIAKEKTEQEFLNQERSFFLPGGCILDKRFVAVILLGLLLSASAWGQGKSAAISVGPVAQPGPFSLGISGSFYVPLADAAQYYVLSGGEDVTLGCQIPGTVLFAFGGISYAYALGKFSAQTIFFVAAELGLGERFPITSVLDLFAYGTGGYWYGTFYDMSVSSTDPCAGIGLELQLALGAAFGLSLGTQYRYYFGLWQGLTAGIGIRMGL